MLAKVVRRPKEMPNYCDVCGAEMSSRPECSLHCEYCRRVLCNSCVAYEETGSIIYRIVWCKDCWEQGEEYRPEIRGLQDRIEKLYSVWKDACKSFNKR